MSKSRRNIVCKWAAIWLTILVLVGGAAAQIPTKGDVFFGYSYNHADFNSAGSLNLNGWEGSLTGKVAPWVGIVADISGQYGSGSSLHNVIFGPRVSFSVGKWTPFVHALIGASHLSGGGASDTSFSDALGGGLDYRLIPLVGWRFQLDALQTRFFSARQNDVRFSSGIVLHF
jgi:hypothetical protein